MSIGIDRHEVDRIVQAAIRRRASKGPDGIIEGVAMAVGEVIEKNNREIERSLRRLGVLADRAEDQEGPQS